MARRSRRGPRNFAQQAMQSSNEDAESAAYAENMVEATDNQESEENISNDTPQRASNEEVSVENHENNANEVHETQKKEPEANIEEKSSSERDNETPSHEKEVNSNSNESPSTDSGDEVPSYISEAPEGLNSEEEYGFDPNEEYRDPTEEMGLLERSMYKAEQSKSMAASSERLISDMVDEFSHLSEEDRKELFGILLKENPELLKKLQEAEKNKEVEEESINNDEASNENHGNEETPENKEANQEEERNIEDKKETAPESQKEKREAPEEDNSKPNEEPSDIDEIKEAIKDKLNANNDKGSNQAPKNYRERTINNGAGLGQKINDDVPNYNRGQGYNRERSEPIENQNNNVERTAPVTYSTGFGGRRTNPFITPDANKRFDDSIADNAINVSNLLGVHNSSVGRLNSTYDEVGVNDVLHDDSLSQEEKEKRISKIFKENPSLTKQLKDIAIIDKEIVDRSRMARKDIDIAESRGIDTRRIQEHLSKAYGKGVAEPNYIPPEKGLKSIFEDFMKVIKELIKSFRDLFVKKEARTPSGPEM